MEFPARWRQARKQTLMLSLEITSRSGKPRSAAPPALPGPGPPPRSPRGPSGALRAKRAWQCSQRCKSRCDELARSTARHHQRAHT